MGEAIRGCALPSDYAQRISRMREGDRVKVSQIILKTPAGKAIKVKGVVFEKMD